MSNFEKIINHRLAKYAKTQYLSDKIIHQEKDLCQRVGIITQGEVHLVHHSITGKAIIMGTLSKGDVFGDFLIFSSNPYYPGDLISKKPTTVIYLSKDELVNELRQDYDFQLFYNSQLSEKALKLNIHNKILNLPSIRERIIVYLEIHMSKLEKSKVFISSKTQLSNYLNIQRPSLSRELKKMKEAKIIDFDRRYIWFVNP